MPDLPPPPPTPRRGFLRREWPACLCAVVLVTLFLLGRSPYFVERVYAGAISPFLCRGLSLVTGPIPFSVAELGLIGAVVGTLFLLGRGSVRVVRRRVPLRRSVGVGLRRLVRAALLIATVFYATWGMNYERAPLPERSGWPASAAPADRAAQTAELLAMTKAAVELTNAAYREACGSDDLGEPSRWPGTPEELEQALERGLDGAGYELDLDVTFQSSRGRSKRPALLAPLMSRLFLSGFFFPWTGEANVNPEPPDCEKLHVVAHEKSHQRGIAREDEAEFVGFVAGARAPSPYLRYTAFLYAQRALLRELQHLDGKAAGELARARSAGVQRDLAAVNSFWLPRQGKLSRIAITINDTYLKSHGIKQGVRNYAAAADLLVRFARLRGGFATAYVASK
ncbi:MAG: DUF3810 domain-containing protein [Planctomycetota bacterium]